MKKIILTLAILLLTKQSFALTWINSNIVEKNSIKIDYNFPNFGVGIQKYYSNLPGNPEHFSFDWTINGAADVKYNVLRDDRFGIEYKSPKITFSEPVYLISFDYNLNPNFPYWQPFMPTEPVSEVVFDLLPTPSASLISIDNFTYQLASTTVVPEPLSTTLFLVGSCAFGFAGYKRRKQLT